MAQDKRPCTLTELAGMPIMTRETGRKLGNVKDIIFDPVAGRLEALTIESNGFFGPKRRFVLAQDIRNIGEDAVMVDTGRVLRNPDNARREQDIVERAITLTDKTVVTEDGNILGNVSDVYIDPDTGKAQRYEVSGGTAADVGAGRRVFPVPEALVIGPDALVVPDSVEGQMQAQEAGGLAGAYRGTKEQAQGAWDSVKDWWRDVTKSAADKEAEYVLGKRADRTVRDDQGNVIVWKDEQIDQEDIDQGRRTGKLGALTASVTATGARGAFGRIGETTRGAYETAKGGVTGATEEYGRRSLTGQQREMALGKVSAVDIRDDAGNLLIAEGEMFTPMILDRLEREDRLEQIRLMPVMGPERVPGEVQVPRIELVVCSEDAHRRQD